MATNLELMPSSSFEINKFCLEAATKHSSTDQNHHQRQDAAMNLINRRELVSVSRASNRCHSKPVASMLRRSSSMPAGSSSCSINNRHQVFPSSLLLPLQPPPPQTLVASTKTPSLKSEDSRFFVDLFGRLLSLIPQSQEFEVCPQCLKSDEDPFVGILNETKIEMSCCHLRTFLDLAPTSPVFKTAFTPFGQQLQSLNSLYDIDLRSRLGEHWRRNWIALGAEGLHRYLRRFISHTDDDGVVWGFGECSLCYAPCRFVRKPSCCRSAICQTCWTSYVRTVAEESYLAMQLTGMYNLHCYACSKFVPYSEALACTEQADMKSIKPTGHAITSARCPVCLVNAPPIANFIKLSSSSPNITNADAVTGQAHVMAAIKKLRNKRGGQPVICERCQHEFCAICGTANHPKISCDQLIATDAGFRQWTKQKSNVRPQFPNGRFCPGCHIPVTHSGGCPHMVCPCGVNFCYSCGRRHYNKALSRFLPSHGGSRMIPIITCPKLWNSQPKRILAHSLVSLGLVVGVGPLVLAVSPVAFPVILALFLVKKYKQRRRRIK